MFVRIALVAGMGLIGSFPWVASVIFAGESGSSPMLAWILVATFVVALLGLLTSTERTQGDAAAPASIGILLGVFFISAPAMIDDVTRNDPFLIGIGIAFSAIAVGWALFERAPNGS